MSGQRDQGEQGVAVVLATALTGILVSVTIAVVCGVALVATHQSAQAAADLAALAGAGALQQGGDACGRAASVARANRAELRRCRVTGWEVAVVVSRSARLPYVRADLPARARAGPAA